MKRIIRILIVALAMAGLGANCWRGEAQGTQNVQEAKDYNYFRALEVMNESGDYEKALELIGKQLQSAPGDVKTLVFRCKLNRDLGHYGEALADINAAIKNNNKKSEFTNAMLYWWKACVYDDMGDRDGNMRNLELAYSLARKNRKKEGENYANLCHNYCDKLTRAGRDAESLAICRELLKEDESDIVAASLAARNMLVVGDLEGAGKIIREYSRFGSDNTEFDYASMKYWEAVGDRHKAVDAALDYVGHYDAEQIGVVIETLKADKKYSETMLRKRIKDGSENKPTWQGILALYYYNTLDYELALKEFFQIIEEYGIKDELAQYVARCYDMLGMPEEAVKTLKEAEEAQIKENPWYYYCLLGDYYQDCGHYEDATSVLDKAIEEDPADAFPYYKSGWCYEFLGDDAKALERYSSGIEMDDSYPYIFLMRGEIYLKQGKKELADADFKAVVEKDTVFSESSCRQYALFFLGRDKEALEWQDSLAAKFPDKPGTYYDQACLYSRMGRTEDALKAIKTALERGYNNFQHIADDNDLDPIRNIPEFVSLVGKYKAEHLAFVERLRRELRAESADSLDSGTITEVAFKRHQGGTFEIPCEVNGLPLQMLFDTGASSVTLSSVEANFMLKNDYLSTKDLGGKEYYRIADGGLTEGTLVTLREVKIGDFILKNVKASVVANQKAPILLGQSVMERFGTITIDNIGGKLLIKH